MPFGTFDFKKPTFKKVSDVVWDIDKDFKEGMRVPARIIATRGILEQMDLQVYDQISNVATLPGIQKYAYCMPDGHSGYGFPIGGVAAFDVDDGGVISPGGIGFDVNCGMRLVLTNLTYGQVKPHLKTLVERFFEMIPVGVGGTGFVRLTKDRFRKVLEEGGRWAVDNGYGWEDDLTKTELGAVADWADVSEWAHLPRHLRGDSRIEVRDRKAAWPTYSLGSVLVPFGFLLAVAFPHFAAVRATALVLRSIHELFWALLLIQVFGLGPATGVLAIAIPYAGIFAKVFAEIIEEADLSAEKVLPAGTSAVSAFAFARLPERARAEGLAPLEFMRRYGAFEIQRGVVLQGPEGPRVVLYDGNRQEYERKTGKVSILYFTQYTIDVSTLAVERETYREPAGRFLHELFDPGDSPDDRANRYKLIAEGHNRLIVPFFALSLPFLALAMLLGGEFNKRGQLPRLVAACAAVAAVQGMAIGFLNAAGKTPEVVPLMYLNAVAPALIGAWALFAGRRTPRAWTGPLAAEAPR